MNDERKIAELREWAEQGRTFDLASDQAQWEWWAERVLPLLRAHDSLQGHVRRLEKSNEGLSLESHNFRMAVIQVLDKWEWMDDAQRFEFLEAALRNE